MLKTILVILLGIFFLLNGINHLFNRHILEEYAHKRGMISPRLAVLLSGLLLIFGGLTLITGYWTLLGIVGLSMFLVISALTIHQFWAEKTADMRMMESMHFAKNMAILTELLYLASG